MRRYVCQASQFRVHTEVRNDLPRIVFGFGNADWTMFTITALAPSEAQQLLEAVRGWYSPIDHGDTDQDESLDLPDSGLTIGPGARGGLVAVFDTDGQQGDPDHKVIWHTSADLGEHLSACLQQALVAVQR